MVILFTIDRRAIDCVITMHQKLGNLVGKKQHEISAKVPSAGFTPSIPPPCLS